jgi:hypothetical protein
VPVRAFEGKRYKNSFQLRQQEQLYVPMSAPPFGICGNNTQNAAVADKRQIELAVSLRTETTRTSALRENEKPTLLTRRQIILDGAHRNGHDAFDGAAEINPNA